MRHQSLQKRFPNLFAYLKAANPYADWDISQRYQANGTVAKNRVDLHRESAKRLLGAVGISGSTI